MNRPDDLDLWWTEAWFEREWARREEMGMNEESFLDAGEEPEPDTKPEPSPVQMDVKQTLKSALAGKQLIAATAKIQKHRRWLCWHSRIGSARRRCGKNWEGFPDAEEESEPGWALTVAVYLLAIVCSVIVLSLLLAEMARVLGGR